MRKGLRAVAIILAATAGVRTYAQTHFEFTTIILEYEGPSDRPVFPIVVSVSNEEGEWFTKRFFGDPDFGLNPINLVEEATMEEISEIPMFQFIVNRPITKYGPIGPPTIRLIAGTGHDYKGALISAGNSIGIIDEIKRHASAYPPLVEQLSEFEGRIKEGVGQQR